MRADDARLNDLRRQEDAKRLNIALTRIDKAQRMAGQLNQDANALAADAAKTINDVLSSTAFKQIRKGLFAGVALEGATLREDLDDNATLYGKKLENSDIVTKGVRPPKAAAQLLALLNRYSAKERKN